MKNDVDVAVTFDDEDATNAPQSTRFRICQEFPGKLAGGLSGGDAGLFPGQ